MLSKKLVFSLALILIISGCSLPTNTSIAGGNGVEIKSFYFSPSSVSSGQKTLLSVGVVNKGDVDATNVVVKVLGFVAGANGWQVSADEKGETVKGITEGQYELDYVEELVHGEKDKNVFPGEISRTLILQAPRTELDISPEIWARVCYTYGNKEKKIYGIEAVGNVDIISEEQMLFEQGNIRQHQISLKQKSGPLKVKVDSMQPLVVSKTGNKPRLEFEIEVENIGGGTATYYDFDSEEDSFDCTKPISEEQNKNNLNKVKLSVEIDGKEVCSDSSRNIYLTKGKKGKFKCIVDCGNTEDKNEICSTLQAFSDQSGSKRTLDLKLRSIYKYYKDSKASIKIKGMEGSLEEELKLPVLLKDVTRA